MSPTTSSSVGTPVPSAAAAQRYRRSSARYLAELRAAAESGGTDGEATILAMAGALGQWWRQPDAETLSTLAIAAQQPSRNGQQPDTAARDLQHAVAERDRAERELLEPAAAALGIDPHRPSGVEAVGILLYGTARYAMLVGLERAAKALPAAVSTARRVMAGSAAAP